MNPLDPSLQITTLLPHICADCCSNVVFLVIYLISFLPDYVNYLMIVLTWNFSCSHNLFWLNRLAYISSSWVEHCILINCSITTGSDCFTEKIPKIVFSLLNVHFSKDPYETFWTNEFCYQKYIEFGIFDLSRYLSCLWIKVYFWLFFIQRGLNN